MNERGAVCPSNSSIETKEECFEAVKSSFGFKTFKKSNAKAKPYRCSTRGKTVFFNGNEIGTDIKETYNTVCHSQSPVGTQLVFMNGRGVVCPSNSSIETEKECFDAEKSLFGTKHTRVKSNKSMPYGCSAKGKTIYFNTRKLGTDKKEKYFTVCHHQSF